MIAHDVNNVRCSLLALAGLCADADVPHEVVAKELLDACDRLGAIVRVVIERQKAASA